VEHDAPGQDAAVGFQLHPDDHVVALDRPLAIDRAMEPERP
jgi:hypothetical protein